MKQRSNLAHKVVWITGASSGLGKALAQHCALHGAEVILMARRLTELEKVRQSLSDPDRHICIAADITDENQVRHAYEQVLAEKGRVDWLINNAGVSQRSLIMETTEDVERQIMEIDYFAQTRLTRLVLPDMIAQGGGKIVMVSSVAGLLGTQYRGAYGAAKAAIGAAALGKGLHDIH